jgi:hypothetical protein
MRGSSQKHPIAGLPVRKTVGAAATLQAGKRYTIQLRPVDGDILFFIEHLETFGADAWSTECPHD